MRRLLGTLGLLAAGLLVAAPATPAYAIPSGGASADTTGTSASVSPRTLHPGDTIHFTVSGFPAGETVSIKIDDQKFCSTLVSFGACVVHQQRVGSNGVASGSFVLPADIPVNKKHWLRFLASKDEGGKITPYSCRGNTDFTVVAAAAQAAGGEPAATATGAPTTTTGSSAPSGAPVTAPSVVPAGKVLTVPAPGGTASSSSTSSADSSAAGEPSASPSAPATATDEAAATPAAAAADRTDESHVPVVGIVGLVLLAAAALGIALQLRRGSKGRA
ncbi:hypothetical protein AB3X52_03415 [Nocardioides sp. DS6]|uniref:LPXTG cell wall anchor domain-containing protein n=1 Tax=Nocardioides eburneus TaxID=3231482 RepID=A0ABV3SUN9_9ACTN